MDSETYFSNQCSNNNKSFYSHHLYNLFHPYLSKKKKTTTT